MWKECAEAKRIIENRSDNWIIDSYESIISMLFVSCTVLSLGLIHGTMVPRVWRRESVFSNSCQYTNAWLSYSRSPPHVFIVSIGCRLFGFSLCFKSALLMAWQTKPFSCFWHADTLAACALLMPIWWKDLLNKTDTWSWIAGPGKECVYVCAKKTENPDSPDFVCCLF